MLRALVQMLQFSREVTGEVPLHDDPRFGIGGKIRFQSLNFPTHGSYRLYRYRVDVSRGAAQ